MAVLSEEGIPGVPADGNPKGSPYLQVDAWEEADGTRTVMVVAMGHTRGNAWMVANDVARGRWEAASGFVALSFGRLDRDLVSRTLEWGTASRRDLEAFAPRGGDAPLADWMMQALGFPSVVPNPRAGMVGSESPQRSRDWKPAYWPIGRDANERVEASEYGHVAPGQDRLHPRGGDRHEGDTRAPAGAVAPTTGMSRIVPYDPFSMEEPETRAIAEAMARWVGGFLPTPGDRAALDLLGERWTPRSHAFYAAPGTVGERRRQAAALNPALALVISAREEVAGRIDAGRPHEETLAHAIRPFVATEARDRVTPALLRRLRSLPPMVFPNMAMTVNVASRMPVDWLPRDAAGWHALLTRGSTVLERSDRLGLDLTDLSHHVSGDWTRMLEGLQPARRRDPEGALHRAMAGAMDMARRLSDTLVSQATHALGLPHGREAFSGALLFGGKSLPAVDRLQARWHGAMTTFEAALPRPRVNNAWPVPFPPFRASNGLEVACIPDDAGLREEGAGAAEGDPVGGGLAHCVGGYGRRCFAATSFVASVRRPLAEGFERVSTVEFGARGGALSVLQNQGLRNAVASTPAREAVAELLAALRAGTHPLDGQALLPRSDHGYVSAFGWEDGEAMGSVLAAWAPYLPRDVARGGMDALAERLRADAVRLGLVPEDARADMGPAP